MLRSISNLSDVTIADRDGEIGAVGDLLFDDGGWTVRYLVIDDGGLVPERQLLVPPVAIEDANRTDNRLPLAVTRHQVVNGPRVGLGESVSRRLEEQIYGYFGWEPYWADDNPDEEDEEPSIQEEVELVDARQIEKDPTDEPEGRPHLRSAREVMGYHVRADGAVVGRVDDLIVDDEEWVVRFVVLDAGDEGLDRKLLLAAELIDRISYEDYAVFLTVEADKIAGAPVYDPTVPLDEEYEEVLEDYFGY